MSAFKRIQSSDVLTIPYVANKTCSIPATEYINYTYIADKFPPTSSVFRGQDMKLVFDYIDQHYYQHFAGVTASLADRLQSNNYENVTGSIAKNSYTTDLTTYGQLNIIKEYNQTILCIIKIPASIFSEGIVEGSLTISSSDGLLAYDDGYGNLCDPVRGNVIIGNIFYDKGEIVFRDSLPAEAVYYDEFVSQEPVRILSFKNKHTVFEKVFKLTLKSDEFNKTYNPTTIQSGSADLIQDTFVSSSFSPYITGVGLYSEKNELLAVAKFGQPILKSNNIDTNIFIKIDM